MTITISEIEAELQIELLTCSECHIPTRTRPAENVPAQALRYGINCEHVFCMELPPLHLANLSANDLRPSSESHSHSRRRHH